MVRQLIDQLFEDFLINLNLSIFYFILQNLVPFKWKNFRQMVYVRNIFLAEIIIESGEKKIEFSISLSNFFHLIYISSSFRVL